MDTAKTLADARRRPPWSLQGVLSLLVLAGVWQLVSLVTPEYIVPGWQVILRQLGTLISLHWNWIIVTSARVVLALLISFLLGCSTAVCMFWSERLERLLAAPIRVLMAVPVICWVLFAVLWFRGIELRILMVLVVVCAPIFLIDVLDAMRAVPSDWIEMVRSFRPTRFQLLKKVLAPAILPNVITSWKVNLSLAIRVVTIAELVGATSGIGYGLTVAQSQLSIADIFAWTLILVALLLSCQSVISVLENRTLRWRQG